MIEGHGDDLYKYQRPIRVNFSSNLTNWIDVTPLKQYLKERLPDSLTAYPEPMPYTLEAQLAHHLQLDASQVCVTNGATEAIYLIAQAFARATSGVLQPTFSEYADACRIHGHQVKSLYSLPPEALWPEKMRLLWMCNPNNPTGMVVPKATLEACIEQHPEVLFVIDQSYEAFTAQPLLSAAEAAQWPNVLLIHSMTKRYGIPGLRLGYVTGCEALLHHLRTHRMPWSVNAAALLAGTFILQQPEAMPFNLARCLEETQRLQELLRQTGGLEPWDTDTHFLLVKLRMGKAAALKEYLAEQHGFLIRDASNFEGLDDRFFRISTQQPAQNEALVKAIVTWFTE